MGFGSKLNYADNDLLQTEKKIGDVDYTNDGSLQEQVNNLNTALSGKSPSTHTHTKAQIGLGNADNTADANKSVKYAASAGSVAWGNVSGKPSSYAPSSHTHDDRYYTESEINTIANAKMPLNPPNIEMYGSPPYIDFHYNKSNADFTSRIIEEPASLNIVGKPLCVENLSVAGSYIIKDVVVASGSSGKWRYWKWASGLAICISSNIIGGNFAGNTWGSLYDMPSLSPGAYPFTFAETPFCFAARTTADSVSFNGEFFMISMSGGSQTTAPNFSIVNIKPITVGHPGLGAVAIGRWK